AKTVSNFESFWIKRTRRTHLRGNLRTNSNQHSRYAFHFDFPLDRDDRAVTDVGSTAGENNRVGTRTFVDLVRDFARRAFVHRLELHGVAHIADVLFGNPADEAFAFDIAQHVDRKDDVDVLVGVRVIV